MKLIEVTFAEAAKRDGLLRLSWGSPLTVRQFEARERAFRAHRWSREALQAWQWVDGSGRVLSSCETFRMPSQVGSADGLTFGVASVFTAPELRGQGAAMAMLEALHQRLATEVSIQATVLFSEIGEALYAPLGYIGVAPFDLLFDGAQPGSAKPSDVTWGLHAPTPEPRADGVLQVLVTDAQLDWHLERSRFYAPMLNRTLPVEWGASTRDGSIGWMANFRNDVLEALFIRGASTRPLIAAAQWAAASAGLARVRVWHTGSINGGSRVPREHNVPMFRSFGPALTSWSPIERALWV